MTFEQLTQEALEANFFTKEQKAAIESFKETIAERYEITLKPKQ